MTKRSFKRGDSLTEHEEHFLRHNLRCPDCEKGKLLEGPSGGISQNAICEYCGSRFNLCGMFRVDRISEPCPDKPELRKDLPGTHKMGVYR